MESNIEIIRSKAGIFSSCAGPLLCASPAAAKLVGIDAAILLNNLVIHYGYCSEMKERPYDFYDQIFYKLDPAKFEVNLEGIFELDDYSYSFGKLEEFALIKIITVNDELYFRILHEDT